MERAFRVHRPNRDWWLSGPQHKLVDQVKSMNIFITLTRLVGIANVKLDVTSGELNTNQINEGYRLWEHSSI